MFKKFSYLASAAIFSSLLLGSECHAMFEEGIENKPSKHQFRDPFEGRDPFKDYTLEKKFEFFQNMKRISKQEISNLKENLDNLEIYVSCKKKGTTPEELEEKLIAQLSENILSGRSLITRGFDSHNIINEFYVEGVKVFCDDHIDFKSTLLTKEYKDLLQFFLDEGVDHYHYYDTRMKKVTEKPRAEELENYRIQSKHLSMMNSDRKGKLGAGVKVMVWDHFPRNEDSKDLLYNDRLSKKIPTEALTEAQRACNWLPSEGDHGVHVAGLIADDDFGVAPHVQIIPKGAHGVAVSGGMAPWHKKFPKEIQEILENDYGAKIINCSFDFPDVTLHNIDYYRKRPKDLKKLNLGLIELCKNHLVVLAAGNKGAYVPQFVELFAQLDENVRKHLFVVVNVDEDGQKLSPSCNTFRKDSLVSQEVGIAAPGTDIISTIPQNTIKQFGIMTGTSMAAPLVSGLLARLISDYPEASITEIADLVRQGTNREGPFNDPEKFGQGMIDVQNTYKLAKERFKK